MMLLKVAGWLVFVAALLHVGIIVGGPDWYRFFGAGEPMAVMSEQGLWYPAIVTACIAALLFVWSLYAFSGAGLIRRLPLLKTALLVIGAIFLLRGLLAVPLLFFADSPYMAELKEKMVFMLVTSFLCLLLAVGYLSGVWLLYRQRGKV
ncbi:MAG: hypothetical protein Q7T48_22250 [Cellvibrio sp.]|uniref:hypothetical protein n=1 Tax=Cellvibrio sp. TaxID=1965322 RepID=UPI00271A8A3D|nr:hypothetical protein [Cellvibrio sp.]